ncbi:MAG: nucleotide sugar dehydrogenase [Candidatus Omnitrophica bacterium]|nr:nucleotide sugar dehydrogenase [Candidatus Omnitrophota bacterium]
MKLAVNELCRKIRSGAAQIAVVGLGYVGLPLAVAFAKKGFRVIGVDTDRRKIASLSAGRSYVLDVRSDDLGRVLRRGRFTPAADYAQIASSDAVIVCVPTPLSKTKEPDISFVVQATKSILRHLKKGQLVVLESTTYPGTTEEVVLPLLQKSGLRFEKDFFLAFSPERVDPGNKQYPITSIPKIVGGAGPASGMAAKTLYGTIMRRVVPVSSARAAEMAKLLENTFRSVNIGLINEIALMCQRLGVDIWEVIGAAKTKPFGFMAFYPGPGIGGHCLPIDPLYLSWTSRLHGFTARMIELAASVNEEMPVHVVERIAHLLGLRRLPLKHSEVLVLGLTYKKNVNDLRESPALDVLKILLSKGAGVNYSDPYIPSVRLQRQTLRSRRLSPSFLKRQKCVVVLTDHALFDYASVVRHSSLVLDTRNALRKFHPRENLFFL